MEGSLASYLLIFGGSVSLLAIVVMWNNKRFVRYNFRFCGVLLSAILFLPLIISIAAIKKGYWPPPFAASFFLGVSVVISACVLVISLPSNFGTPGDIKTLLKMSSITSILYLVGATIWMLVVR